MASLDFDAVTKCFPGAVTALDRFSLAIADRELVVLVGPSAAGKTTALRIAAGLERATSGSVRMDGRPIDDWKPKDRDMAMVFQQPALYPHLTVRDNIAFPLRMRRTSRAEIGRLIAKFAAELGITDVLDRFPSTLSGGQSQRVALARALVRRPNALLLDEPLASLDAPLRLELRRDLRQAHRREPVTMIFVTHDQDEAIALADRLVVLRAGRVEQVGTPELVYERPVNRFVASFLGSPPINLLDGMLTAHGEQLRFELGDWWLAVNGTARARLLPYIGQTVTLGLRPQDLTLAPVSTPSDSPRPIDVTVSDIEFCGDRELIRGVTKSGASLVAFIDRPASVLADSVVHFFARSDRAGYFSCGNDGRNLLMG